MVYTPGSRKCSHNSRYETHSEYFVSFARRKVGPHVTMLPKEALQFCTVRFDQGLVVIDKADSRVAKI
jgi:hypothetical protein